MANLTPNYGLGKPLSTEKYDVNVLNGNADKVDTELKKVSDRVEEVAISPANFKNDLKTYTYEMAVQDGEVGILVKEVI